MSKLAAQNRSFIFDLDVAFFLFTQSFNSTAVPVPCVCSVVLEAQEHWRSSRTRTMKGDRFGAVRPTREFFCPAQARQIASHLHDMSTSTASGKIRAYFGESVINQTMAEPRSQPRLLLLIVGDPIGGYSEFGHSAADVQS